MLSFCHFTRSLAFEVLEYVECDVPGATVSEIARELQARIEDVLSAIASEPWLMIEGPADNPDHARVFMSLA